MKKRILALALAGTTAFSVFGAAVTADAASSHVVFGNDPYTSYKSAEVTFSTTDAWTATLKDTTWTYTTQEFNQKVPYANKDALVEYVYSNQTDVWKEKVPALGYTAVDSQNIYKHSFYYAGSDFPYKVVYSASSAPMAADDKVTSMELAEYQTLMNTTRVYTNKNDTYANTGKLYTLEEVKEAVGNKLNEDPAYYSKIQANYTYNGNGSVTVDPQYAYKYNWAYGDGELVTDELSRTGVAVENGNVYAYDYFSNTSGIAQLEAAWDAANFQKVYVNGVYTSLKNSSNATSLIGMLTNLNRENPADTINADDAIFGRGGYYDARTAVIEEYEDFLVEIGVLTYGWNGNLVKAVTEADFLKSYSYKYDTVDEYNFEGLVSDLFATVTGTWNNFDKDYEYLPSSELVYLMQQYDKYVDGSYIEEDEVDESTWANLLIECLNAVTADDFTTTSAYNSYNRLAEAAISRYESATTPAQQTYAIEGLYKAVTASYGRATTSDKTELVNSLNSLYFNNKNIPDVYMTAVSGKNDSNANLVLYGYGVAQDVIDASIKTTQSTIKAVYPLYPVADYYQKDRKGAEYAGIKAGTVPDDVTAEYEWFANVYQLATEINGKATPASYQGMIDTVNDALNSAVEALAPTKTPAGSTTLRLEEAVEKYADKIDTDYLTKYYDAYTKANDYAGVVEGNTQTKYAIEMVIVSGETLGYQGAQNTVTKGMISELKTAIKNANTALTALKNDEDNYNAAQVNALNKAIATADALVSDYNGNAGTKVNGVPTKTAGDKDNFVISDVNKAIEAIDAAINFKEVLQGWHEFDEGWKYGYIKEDGTAAYVESGWYKVGASWFYFRDSIALENEWIKEDGKWYYLNSNCAAAYGWAKVDGKWYYFNGDNSMRTGWVKTGGHWYYLNAGGAMVTGWAQIDGKWYYFSKTENAIGQMLANTTTPDGCKVDENGVWVK